MLEYTDREGKLLDILHDIEQDAIDDLRDLRDDPDSYANGYETGTLHTVIRIKSEIRKLIESDK